MFADDTTLYASHRNISYLNYILQEDLANLNAWFKANSLSLNISKTLVMKFWTGSGTENVQLELDDTHLPVVNNTKFLGVTIDSKLKWTEHICSSMEKGWANPL